MLAEELEKDAPLEKSLDSFVRRRFERCQFILQASLQIGEWEMHPDPQADVASLMAKVAHTVVQPI